MKNVKQGHEWPIIVLDAGHYGKYNRSPVVPAYYESEMNWKLARFLRAESETYGMEVRMTRTEQAKDLSLSQRGKQAEGADLLASLHSNACDTEAVDRPVGIYLIDDNCGPIDEQSERIARILAKTVEEVMGTDGHAQVYSRKCSYDRDGDGLKNDDYYGILFAAHQAGTAAVILEHSFHTNIRAAKWLLIDANLRRMARAEAQVLAEYFGMDDMVRAEELPASGVSDSYRRDYRTTAKSLCLRSGAGTKPNKHGDNKAILAKLPKGTIVHATGCYTKINGIRWHYVHCTHEGCRYAGFVSGKYLRKV